MKQLKIIVVLLPILLLTISCTGRSVEPDPDLSPDDSGLTETSDAEESIDWSTVTPDILWEGVGQIYAEDGPAFALSLLDQGILNDVVTEVEADQTRAGFLFELGRIDEAFMALSRYQITSERPDLLRLRAEILWQMGRYDEARRDYECVLNTYGPETDPMIRISVARLYSDLGEWDLVDEQIEAVSESGDNETLWAYKLGEAYLTENPETIREAAGSYTGFQSGENEDGDMPPYAMAYIDMLEGRLSNAEATLRTELPSEYYSAGLAQFLLKLDTELGNFDQFEVDLEMFMTQLGASSWLGPESGSYPQPVTDPMSVAWLLNAAASFDMGHADLVNAALLLDRADDLYPYNYVTYLQRGVLSVINGDYESAYTDFNEALRLSPPSDLRAKLRIMQYGISLKTFDGSFDNLDTIALPDESVIGHWESAYPENAFFKSVRAEMYGWTGNYDDALAEIETACGLPGATREMHYRMAYFLALTGSIDEAISIIETHVPPGSPYLTWVLALDRETESRRAESTTIAANLETFAQALRDILGTSSDDDAGS